jgi:hypothetical protein
MDTLVENIIPDVFGVGHLILALVISTEMRLDDIRELSGGVLDISRDAAVRRAKEAIARIATGHPDQRTAIDDLASRAGLASAELNMAMLEVAMKNRLL